MLVILSNGNWYEPLVGSCVVDECGILRVVCSRDSGGGGGGGGGLGSGLIFGRDAGG
jgi:hypothetical protein